MNKKKDKLSEKKRKYKDENDGRESWDSGTKLHICLFVLIFYGRKQF